MYFDMLIHTNPNICCYAVLYTMPNGGNLGNYVDNHDNMPLVMVEVISWVNCPGKSAFVLLSYVISCPMYSLDDLTTSFDLSLPLFDCLCKSHVLTNVTIIFLHLYKL